MHWKWKEANRAALCFEVELCVLFYACRSLKSPEQHIAQPRILLCISSDLYIIHIYWTDSSERMCVCIQKSWHVFDTKRSNLWLFFPKCRWTIYHKWRLNMFWTSRFDLSQWQTQKHLSVHSCLAAGGLLPLILDIKHLHYIEGCQSALKYRFKLCWGQRNNEQHPDKTVSLIKQASNCPRHPERHQ